jgi:hypothetical protein
MLQLDAQISFKIEAQAHTGSSHTLNKSSNARKQLTQNEKLSALAPRPTL